jgi:hypothetical protein
MDMGDASVRIVYAFGEPFSPGQADEYPALVTTYPEGRAYSHHPRGAGHRAQMFIGDVGVLIVSVF